MLITTLTFGGAETQVVRLAEELNALGWTVAVACMVAPKAYRARLEDAGIAVYSLDMARGVPDPRAVFRLRDLIRNFQPDVVHSHMVHANLLGRAVRLVCRFSALICTAHNLRETSEKGGPTWHKELLYRLTDSLANCTTIICHAARERYIQVGAVPADKLELVPNGVDTERFAPSRESRLAARKSLGLDSEFVWLAVGRLVEQKDYPNLFRALETAGPGNYRVLIAGNGPLADQLEADCATRGLADRVQFVGARENILELYHAADAYVMSSRFEGLSAALLEAAAMGLPSVVTDAGGNRDIVLEGQTGYIVQPENAEQLGKAMTALMNASAEARERFSIAARRHCLENYRFETITTRWIDLYSRYIPRLRNSVPTLTFQQGVGA
jgi:glycosyltransferase involved in cell wall biosynthesis